MVEQVRIPTSFKNRSEVDQKEAAEVNIVRTNATMPPKEALKTIPTPAVEKSGHISAQLKQQCDDLMKKIAVAKGNDLQKILEEANDLRKQLFGKQNSASPTAVRQ